MANGNCDSDAIQRTFCPGSTARKVVPAHSATAPRLSKTSIQSSGTTEAWKFGKRAGHEGRRARIPPENISVDKHYRSIRNGGSSMLECLNVAGSSSKCSFGACRALTRAPAAVIARLDHASNHRTCGWRKCPHRADKAGLLGLPAQARSSRAMTVGGEAPEPKTHVAWMPGSRSRAPRNDDYFCVAAGFSGAPCRIAGLSASDMPSASASSAATIFHTSSGLRS